MSWVLLRQQKRVKMGDWNGYTQLLQNKRDDYVWTEVSCITAACDKKNVQIVSGINLLPRENALCTLLQAESPRRAY